MDAAWRAAAVRIRLASMTARTKGRALGCAAIAVIVALAAGCGGSSSSSATTTPSGRSGPVHPATTTTGTPPASQLVLTVNDLPIGWAIDNSPPATAADSCFHDPLTKVPTTSYAEANFAYPGGHPIVVQKVGIYASSARAFQAITASLHKCTSFRETMTTTGAFAVSPGAMGKMPFPTFGTESAAYVVGETVRGVDAVQIFVIARQGNALDEVGLVDVGSVDDAPLAKLVRIAVTKARVQQAKR
jgi:hypothetical protein